MTAEVTIICATMGACEAVQLTFYSLRRYTPEPHKILVADNSSTDGTLEFLRSLPWVTVFSIEQRLAIYGRENGESVAWANLQKEENPNDLVTCAPVSTNVPIQELAPDSDTFLMGHGQTLDWLTARVDTPFFLTLDSDVEFLDRGWLSEMLELMKRETVDVIGQLELGNDVCQPRLTPDLMLIRTAAFRELSTSLAAFTWLENAEEALRWSAQPHSPVFNRAELAGYSNIRIYDAAAYFFENLQKNGKRWLSIPESTANKFHHLGHMSWASDISEELPTSRLLHDQFRARQSYIRERLQLFT